MIACGERRVGGWEGMMCPLGFRAVEDLDIFFILLVMQEHIPYNFLAGKGGGGGERRRFDRKKRVAKLMQNELSFLVLPTSKSRKFILPPFLLFQYRSAYPSFLPRPVRISPRSAKPKLHHLPSFLPSLGGGGPRVLYLLPHAKVQRKRGSDD